MGVRSRSGDATSDPSVPSSYRRFNTMLKRLLTITFLVVAMAGLARTSQAQYLWMDTNGDGVNTVADKMNANGTPTTVDVWINTSHNKNGTAAVCQSGDPDA